MPSALGRPAKVISATDLKAKLDRGDDFKLAMALSEWAFTEAHIPGSINMPLYAVKTKTFLKSVPVVLVNEGFRYAELESECRRLAERGSKHQRRGALSMASVALPTGDFGGSRVQFLWRRAARCRRSLCGYKKMTSPLISVKNLTLQFKTDEAW